jgi:hypothetical protein
MTDAIALKRTLEVLHASNGTTYVLRGGADAEFKIDGSTARERDLLDLLLEGAPRWASCTATSTASSSTGTPTSGA